MTEDGDSDRCQPPSKHYTSTRHVPPLGPPLGPCQAFRGVEGGILFWHGSQGWAAQIRITVISPSLPPH